jgi:hypothetical protein
VVLDGLFTTGATLDAVARALVTKGRAREVIGLSLARRMGDDDYGQVAVAHADAAESESVASPRSEAS